MICRHCGKEIRDGSKFCSFCGKQIEQEPISEMPQSINNTDIYSNESMISEAVAEQKKRKKLNILFVAIVTIIFAAIIFACFFFTSFLSDMSRIASIQKAVPTIFPDSSTWEDALDEYCEDTDWDFVKANGSNKDHVDFNGVIKSTGEKLYIKFEFISDDKYNITEFDVNDTSIINDPRLEKIAKELFG